MKIALVLSQITYLPDQYESLLDNILDTHNEHINYIVIIENYSHDLLLKILWLYLVGCFGVASVLFSNVIARNQTLVENKANESGIPILRVNSVNTDYFINWVNRKQIDAIVNIRTRCIYKPKVLLAPKYGCYNIHHGLLPKYRGMYCDLYALYEKRPAGVTLHRMNKKIDDGRIIYQEIVVKNQESDYLHYLEATGKFEAKMIKKLINHLFKYKSAPSGKPNGSVNSVFTKTPTSLQLIQMQLSGLNL